MSSYIIIQKLFFISARGKPKTSPNHIALLRQHKKNQKAEINKKHDWILHSPKLLKVK